MPKKFSGQWIAWDQGRREIVAVGNTAKEARSAALAAGERAPILAKAPQADVRLIDVAR